MNQQQTQALTVKNLIPSAVFGLLALTCAVITAFCPPLILVTLALGSAFFAMTKLLDPYGIGEKLVPVVFFIATLLLTKSLALAVLLLGVFFPGGIALANSVRKEKTFNEGVARLFLVLCIYLLIIFGVVLIEYGTDFDPKSIFRPLEDLLKSLLSEVYPFIQKEAALSLNPYLIELPYTEENFVYAFYRVITETLPAYMGLILLAASSIAYWTVKTVIYSRYKKQSVPEQLKFFGSFDTVRVSRAAGIIYILLSFMIMLATSSFELVVITTFKTLLAAALCYDTVSVAAFALKMYNVPKPVRIFISIILFGIAACSSVAVAVFSLVGLMDCFYNIRRFINPAGYVV